MKYKERIEKLLRSDNQDDAKLAVYLIYANNDSDIISWFKEKNNLEGLKDTDFCIRSVRDRFKNYPDEVHHYYFKRGQLHIGFHYDTIILDLQRNADATLGRGAWTVLQEFPIFAE